MSGPLMREIANAVGEDMVDLGEGLGWCGAGTAIRACTAG